MHTSNRPFAQLIKGCLKNKRGAQKGLYMHFYSYGMSICMRYAETRDEAVEILNDGFLKVFQYIGTFKTESPFKPWFRRILINCSIDHFKKQNQMNTTDLEEVNSESTAESQLDLVSYEEMLDIIRKIPPAYRAVFNLHAIEGYKHEEIAEMLDISVGTSKSNYFKARKKLQKLMYEFFEVDK